MADTKTSALTALTQPDIVNDTVPIYDASATLLKQIAVQNLHAIKAAAYLNTATNTTSAGWQKCPLDTVDFDTRSIFNTTSKRFIPDIAGYYQFNGRVRTSTAAYILAACYKNGSIHRVLGTDTTLNGTSGSCIVYCNGTTDYLELWLNAASVRALTTGTVDNWADILGPF